MKRELFKQMLSDIIATEQGEYPLDLRAGKAPFTHKDYDVFDINDLDGVYDYVESSEEWFIDIYANTLVGKFPHADYTGTALTSLSFEDALEKRTKTAESKFNARLKELGLYYDWCQQGCVGRVGVETDKGIAILVHEDESDRFTEFTYPPISEMQKHDSFRIKALNEFYVNFDFDENFARKMIRWVANPNNECPLFPVDVYFLWNEYQWSDFEDDENASVAEYIFAKETEEICGYCDEVVILSQELKVQKCPKCGKWIVPCSACPLTDCVSNCPLEKMANILNK